MTHTSASGLAIYMNTASLIARIHASPVMVVCITTGGGVQAVADLLTVPGASRTVLEAIVPYSLQSLSALLGALPEQVVSEQTAVALAQVAYHRAVALQPDKTTPLLGLSCTAALVTDRPKQGAHRGHVGVRQHGHAEVHSLTLRKGARDRQGEERLLSDLLLHVLGRACGMTELARPALLPVEHIEILTV